MTLCDTSVDGTNLTTYTFASQDIGAASSDRHIVVAIGGRGATQALSTVTVAGQACTIVAQAQATNSSRAALVITDAPVTSGTTAEIVVTFAGGATSCGIAVYSVTGLLSATPVDTGTTVLDNTAVSLDVVPDGAMIGTSSSTAGTATWTNITEDFDADIESGLAQQSAAHDETSSTTTLSLTVDWTSGTVAAAYASFR